MNARKMGIYFKIVEEGRLHGVVSDRDLLRAISPFIGSVVETNRDLGTLNKRVHQIATRKPVTLPGWTVNDRSSTTVLPV